MTTRRLPFFQSLFRNRRGGVCAICCCLVFTVFSLVGVCSFLSIKESKLLDVPLGWISLVTAIGAIKGWQYHRDGSTAPKA